MESFIPELAGAAFVSLTLQVKLGHSIHQLMLWAKLSSAGQCCPRTISVSLVFKDSLNISPTSLWLLAHSKAEV